MRREGAAIETAPEPLGAQPDDSRRLDRTGNPGLTTDWQAALLRPRGVALVGAGLDPNKPSGRPLHLLRRHGFEGAIYPVNADHRLIQGAHAWPDLESLPGPADIAFIFHSGGSALEAIAACGRARIPLAVLGSGNGDAVPAGGILHRPEVLELARDTGVRLLGPGSAGIVIPSSGLSLASDAAFGVRSLTDGRFMLIAQGTGALGALFSRSATRGLGFHALVSTGAEIDLSLGEVGAAAVEESDVDAFLVFLQDMHQPASLARFAAKANAAGKPIVAYRASSGRAARAGAEQAGPGDAFLRAHGIVVVEQLDTLLELAPLLVRRRPARGRTATVVSASSATGPMAANRLAQAGVHVDGLDELARERLAQSEIALLPGPIVDVVGDEPATAVGAVLNEALDAPNNDVVLAVLGEDSESDPEKAVIPLVAASHRADKPLAALVLHDAPEATRRLATAGIAAFRSPETAADGIRAFLQWAPPSAPARLWDDDERLPVIRRSLHAGHAMQVFRMLGVTIPTMLWVRRDGPVPSGLPFPPPYVVKVLSPDIDHRLDIGGVALGLETITAVQAAAETITQCVRIARPDAYLDGVMVQRLERGLAEVSIGFRRDPDAGPIVTLAMGEGMAETYNDRSLRLAPIDRAAAYDMIEEIRGLARVSGHRGRPRGDLDALAHALVAISSFALIASPRVLEATIDPVMIKPKGQGIVALDGWMKTE